MGPTAKRGDGVIISPGDASIPIMHEIERGKLKIIGTGFYITRYGMFLTSRHVFDELVDDKGQFSSICYVRHLAGEDDIYLRRVLTITLHEHFDIALGQADNYQHDHPNNPLMNLRGGLRTSVPSEGMPVLTYAYPENECLDFTTPEGRRIEKGDYFRGEFLEYVETSDHPYIRYPHYRTSIDVRSGASGGPVFDDNGEIIGINCRGWDFGPEAASLSSIVPIKTALTMTNIPLDGVPQISWEYKQIPEKRRGRSASFEELIRFGHVECR